MNIINDKTMKALRGIVLATTVAGAAACGNASAEAEKPKNTPASPTPARVAVQQPPPVVTPAPKNESQVVTNETGEDADREFYARMRERTASRLRDGNKITRANFEKIKMSMKLADVEKMLGDKGSRIGMNNKNGVISETFKWYIDGEDAYIEVTVKDEAVIAKDSHNLP